MERGTPLVVAGHDTGQGWWNESEIAGTLRAEGENRPSRPSNIGVFSSKDHGADVRRLTPRECERLQSFPDDFTRWGSEGKEISDSARYRMLGNAVAVNVAEWIGKRVGVLP
jgi:DNA (cytosine-5)-methyltransferase 1